MTDLFSPAPASTGFALTASYFLFTRCARPSGQPTAVTALRSVCLRERESNQRESAPDIRVSLRSTSLAPVLFRGSSRRAIPGPSFLVWHPCQTPLCTAPPLGLLTGFGDRVVWVICGRQSERHEDIGNKPSWLTPVLSLYVKVKRSYRWQALNHEHQRTAGLYICY